MVGSPGLAVPAADVPDVVPRAEPPSRLGNMAQYEQGGRIYRVLDSSYAYDERGIASWYGSEFQGRPTSSGEPFDMNLMTGAHRTLPLPSYVEVTNLSNGRQVILRVNDRGPFHDTDQRIIDVSYAAAVRLGFAGEGTAPVRVRAVEPWQVRQGP
jgi:rare lipoprotein A